MAEQDVKINVRDCQTMGYQSYDHCANCYKDISTEFQKKFDDDIQFETESNNEDVTVKLVEALNLIFNLHKRSHVTTLILDEHKYSLCRDCFLVFSKLLQLFAKFSDLCSPPSYLYSILGHKSSLHQIIPVVEIKTEDDFVEGGSFDEEISAWSDINADDFSIGDVDSEEESRRTKIPLTKDSKKKTLRRKCKGKRENSSTSNDSYTDSKYLRDDDGDDLSSDLEYPANEDSGEKPCGEDAEDPRDKYFLTSRKRRSKIRAKTHICKECNIGFTRSNHLARHMLLHSCKEYACDCGVGFKSDRNLKYHQKYHCQKNPNATILTQPELRDPIARAFKIARKKQVAKLIKNAKKKPREPKSFVCPHTPCGRVFTRLYRLKRHEKIHVSKPHLCEYCHNSYRDEETLSRHIKTSCRVFNEGAPACDEEMNPEDEERRLKVLDRLQRKRQANNTRRYVCHCGESFSRTNHLRTHSLVHKEKNFVCRGCNAGFVTELRLQKHVRIHDPDYSPNESTVRVRSVFSDDGKLLRSVPKQKKIKKDGKEVATCEVCGKSVSARNLKIHMVSHRGERPMVCELCGNSFKTIWSLKCHQKYAHGTERPFLCKYCGRAFKRNQHMVDHEIVAHSDNRAYVCKEPNCDKSFKSARNLRQHRLLHKGVKFDCPKCGSTFSRKDNLKVHIEKHCGKSTPIRRKTVVEQKPAPSYPTSYSDDPVVQANSVNNLNPMFSRFDSDVPVDVVSDRSRRGRQGRSDSSKASRKTKAKHDTASFPYQEDHASSSSGEHIDGPSCIPMNFQPLQLTAGSAPMSNESEHNQRTAPHPFYSQAQVPPRVSLSSAISSALSSSFPLNMCGGPPIQLIRPNALGFSNDCKHTTPKDNSLADRNPSTSNPSSDAYDLRQYEGIPY